MTETHTPLPCPFCGGEAKSSEHWTSWDTREWAVWCYVECGASVVRKTQAEALTAWNTRAVNSHHDLIEALRAVEAAMVRGGDGRILDTGWNITKLNEARPLIRAILTKAEAGHG